MLTKTQQELLAGKSLADSLEEVLRLLHNVKIVLQGCTPDQMTKLEKQLVHCASLAQGILGDAQWILADLRSQP